MTDQNTNLDLELAIASKQAEEAKAQYEATQKLLQQLKDDRERRLNDPKERAKLLKNANDMIDAGIEDYKSKGYFCEVSHDENGIITKITIKSGKSAKSGTRGPKKKAGDPDFVPAMTGEQFEKIYVQLNEKFVSSDIEKLLTKTFSGAKYRLQPQLKEIADKGFNGIRIQSNGRRGRAAEYTKIS
jgi:hypothetical protein